MLQPMPAPKRSAADELRLMVRNMGDVNESFNDRFTVDELVKIYRAHLKCGWDISPDEWLPRQVSEALRGKVPRWDNNGVPVYATTGTL